MARILKQSVSLSRFGILIAQLESIVSSSLQQPLDSLLCFDLLSDLVSIIEDEPKESIIQWQRKCEDALYSLLILGVRRPVRRLASLAMVRIIEKGDSISIYSRVSSLQGWLADGKRNEPLACAGVMHCLGELYLKFGRRITSGLVETSNIAAKLMKYNEDYVRQEALLMLHNALKGCCGNGSSAAYSEAFRIILRVGVVDKSLVVRLTATKCLRTFAGIGGPGIGVADLENSLSFCVKGLEDPFPSVRDGFAEALGAFLALGMSLTSHEQLEEKNYKSSEMKFEGDLQKHLILPFIRASGSRSRDVRLGLTLSWVFFLQAIRVKYCFPEIEFQNFSLLVMNMLGSSTVDAQSLACVLYTLRVGIVDQMSEQSQKSFLVFLGKQLTAMDTNPSKMVAALRTLSHLLTTLGEVPSEFKEILDDTVVAALSHFTVLVRIEAALTLRALAEVDPTCVGGLISYAVTTLYALHESVFIEKGDRLRIELDSLHGQSLVLASLVSISPRLLLGYPGRLSKLVLDVSKKMLTEYSSHFLAASVEKEAGWTLLASLIASMPKEELEDQVFDILLLWADTFGGNLEYNVTQAQILNSEIRVWSVAMEALTAFIRAFVSPSTAIESGILLQPVLHYLSGALFYISYLTTKSMPELKQLLDLFIIRTLIAYQSLSDPMTFQNDHSQMIQICTAPFRDAARFEESSCLRLLLDKRDACLGPWVPGRDWFEDELRAFDGGSTGLMPCVWDDELSSFPQPDSVSVVLVNQMLLCFGAMFAIKDSAEKLVLLGMIEHCLKSGRKQSSHTASVTNACVGLLAGLKALLLLRPQSLHWDVLSSAQSIFLNILSEAEINVAHRRASAEGLGLLARLGNDTFTARMARALLADLAVVTDPNYVGSIAFALGCIHRSAGGMALSTLVPGTVSSISSLARHSTPIFQFWLLHGLLLTIEAAGLSYVSHVQATLSLAIDIILADENGLVDIRKGVGNLINAIVAVLGPELSPGSIFFQRCKSVVAEISSTQDTSTLLVCIRFTQQLVLFAPQAVSVHSHVQTLLPSLFSRQPSLRHLAVCTLHHLIEKDPVAVIEECIEESLFHVLDNETHSEIGDAIRNTITQLFYASCPTCPSQWIGICRRIILAILPSKSSSDAQAPSSKLSSDNNALQPEGHDDERMVGKSYASNVQIPITDSPLESNTGEKHLRYRTKIFAAEILSQIPVAVGTDLAQFDLSLAREKQSSIEGASRDWLVLHIQELVTVAYQVSTSQFENIQPIGIGLLITIMNKFDMVQDPDLPEHLLLEQFQAQFVSALRIALDTSSGPHLLEAGLQLAAKILTSSIISGDRVALQRIFTSISCLLDEIKDIYYPSFSEWVAGKIKVRLLTAHAAVKCYTYTLLRKYEDRVSDEYISLIPIFSQHSRVLGRYWLQIVEHYIYIWFRVQSKSKYQSFLDGIQTVLVMSKLQGCVTEAMPVVLQAIALDAAPAKISMNDFSNSSIENPSRKSKILSGCRMIELEQKDFFLVWGLAMILLFHKKWPLRDQEARQFLECNNSISQSDSVVNISCVYTSAIETSYLVLLSLCVEGFFKMEFLTLEICQDLLQVLKYEVHDNLLTTHHAVTIVSKIVQLCPVHFFENEDFIYAIVEMFSSHACRSFSSNDDSGSQDDKHFINLLSELFTIAVRVLKHVNRKNPRELILVFLSTSYSCLRESSSNLCLSKVITFVQDVTPLLRTHIKDDSNCAENYMIQLKEVLLFWVDGIVQLSNDCIQKIHWFESKNPTSFKLLLVKLSFCLEEILSLARFAYEAQKQVWKDVENVFFFNVYKQCIKCVHIVLVDANAEIQTIGLYVVKSIAQKEQEEDSKNHCFFLFLIGELIGDFYSLIQRTLKKPIARDSVIVAGECLGLLFRIHTLSKQRKCQKEIFNLLLEAIFLIVSTYGYENLQELIEINNAAIRLMSHLAQVYSQQLRDSLLEMPVGRRQQVQDIIRASFTSLDQSVVSTKTMTVSSHKLPSNEENIMPEDCKAHSAPAACNGDSDDEDDDWDTFQSITTNTDAAELLPSETSGDVSTDDLSIMESDPSEGNSSKKVSKTIDSEILNNGNE